MTCIKLAANENPFGPSPLALRAMEQSLADVNFYPDPDATPLRDALAARVGMQPEQVMVTSGSSDMIQILARAMLGPGLNAVGGDISFFLYPLAVQTVGAQLIRVTMVKHGYDLNAIAAAVNDETRLVLLANPNNPTGTMFDADEFERFLDKVPSRVTVVLDEAYCDFAEDFAGRRGTVYSRGFELVRNGRNVIVMRTFSKAHGLAAVRCGWAAGPAELIACFNRVRLAFSVSSVAQAGAMAALEDDAHIRTTVTNNADGVAVLARELAAMGVEAVPTSANFLYLETAELAVELAQKLQMEGVLVRPLGGWGAPNAIRVTVGTPEQNALFLAAFGKVRAYSSQLTAQS